MDPSNPSSHLAKILIPRVCKLNDKLSIAFDLANALKADTPNNTLVGNYIISTLKALNWHIDIDEFTDQTPLGTKRFRNVIATKDPNASRRVILSAHYDSKYFPRNNRVGLRITDLWPL